MRSQKSTNVLQYAILPEFVNGKPVYLPGVSTLNSAAGDKIEICHRCHFGLFPSTDYPVGMIAPFRISEPLHPGTCSLCGGGGA